MAVFDQAGKAAADRIAGTIEERLPQLESFMDDQRTKIEASAKEIIQNIVACVADGVGQILALGQAVDGTTVEWEFETPIRIPKLIMKVKMPLRPVK